VSSVDGVVTAELDDVDTNRVVTVRQILVVDDTPANLIAVQAALEPLQRTIVTASSGDEALARLLEQDFALLLLDVQMPGLDGYETAKLIRARQRTAHLPIIFMTAHSTDEASVLRAYRLGAVDFMCKPFMPEVLRTKASVFVTLQERTEELATARMERDFEARRRDYEMAALRRERDRELEAKNELARLNEALATSDRRKDSFIAILAHELRNPLAPLRTCIDLLRADSELTPKMLGVLDRQTNVLSRLVDDLLDISRIKADKIELRPEPIDLVKLVEAAIATSRPLLDDRGHTLVVEADSACIDLIADSVRLSQVISNLLNNAARYTPRGGRIVISCGVAGEQAFVRVADNGLGIPQELQPTIFNMFVQERVASDGSGGLGLGLALSRRLVELHAGTISVRSQGRGLGSTFEVLIPTGNSPLALLPRTRTQELEPLKRPASTPAIRTVVIDDNDDARELLSDLLRARGHEVLTASDGPTGLELIRDQRPHVALVDIGLPGMDGISVAETLRAQCPGLTTRLVALTGYGDSSDCERVRRAGFHAHLVKPATAAAILDALRVVPEDSLAPGE
jgi:two-component system, sensor histidine kinase